MALAAWYREYMHAHVERNHARHYGRPEEPTSGSGRLLPNGLRTVS